MNSGILAAAFAFIGPLYAAYPPRLSNTNQDCVKFGEDIAAKQTAPTPEIIARLIQCLETEKFYPHPHGAAKMALNAVGAPAVPALAQALGSSSSYIAEGAAAALGAMGKTAHPAAEELRKILRKKGGDILLPTQAAQALGQIGDMDFLIRVLRGQETGMPPHLGAQGLGAAGPDAARAVPALMDVLNSSDPGHQMYAAEALGKIGAASSPAIPKLGELTGSRYNFLRGSSGEALIQIGTPEALAAARFYRIRKGLWSGFFRGMSVFVWNPLAAVAMAAVFGILLMLRGKPQAEKSSPQWIPGITLLLWALYAVWEWHCRRQGANIRVDLLVIYPVLAIMSLLSLWVWGRGLLRRS